MSSCALTKGKARGCRTGFAGIKRIDFFEWDAIESAVIVAGVVTLALIDGKRAWPYYLEEELGNFKDSGAGSRPNGSYVRTQTLLAPFVNFESNEIDEIELLSQNRLGAVVHYSDGRFRVAGLEVGLMLDSDADDSGTAHEDRNGIEFSFSCKQKHKAPFISASNVLALQTPTS